MLTTTFPSKDYRLNDKALATSLQWKTQNPALLAGPAEDFIRASKWAQFWKRAVAVAVGATVLAALIAILFTQQQNRRNKADQLRERGIRALAEHDFQSAEVLLANSMKVLDTPEARQLLLNARMSGNPLVKEARMPGEVVELSVSGNWAVSPLVSRYVL